jgi:hypothetical protein
MSAVHLRLPCSRLWIVVSNDVYRPLSDLRPRVLSNPSALLSIEKETYKSVLQDRIYRDESQQQKTVFQIPTLKYSNTAIPSDPLTPPVPDFNRRPSTPPLASFPSKVNPSIRTSEAKITRDHQDYKYEYKYSINSLINCQSSNQSKKCLLSKSVIASQKT